MHLEGPVIRHINMEWARFSVNPLKEARYLTCQGADLTEGGGNDEHNNHNTFIRREPLVYTTARRAVQEGNKIALRLGPKKITKRKTKKQKQTNKYTATAFTS